jgi:hypothetical protein
VRERRVDREQAGDEHERDFGLEQEPAAIDRVGERAADERDADERHERAETEQADRERRVRELEDLVRDSDKRQLPTDERDRLTEPEPPERRRLAEGAGVELEAAQYRADSGTLGSGKRLLGELRGATLVAQR